MQFFTPLLFWLTFPHPPARETTRPPLRPSSELHILKSGTEASNPTQNQGIKMSNILYESLDTHK